MKNILLASVALVCVAITPGYATTPIENAGTPNISPNHINLQMLAEKGGSGNSGSGGSDDGADNDSNDDHGGSSGNDNANDNDNDNDADDDGTSDRSNDGGGRRPRVPGGSGCDSAEDRAEHAECNAG